MICVLFTYKFFNLKRGRAEMKLIVLAGGRGRRMGTLINLRQKAVLSFGGSILLEHVINGFLKDERISTVHVLTGYRGEDVRSALFAKYSRELDTGRIAYVDSPCITGTLSRLQASIPEIGTVEDSVVCGIDSFVSTAVLRRFLDFCDRSRQSFSMLLSPYLQIAPTHKVASLSEDLLCEYGCADEMNDCTAREHVTDVGIRYFPAKILEEIAALSHENDVYIPTCIKMMLRRGDGIRGFVFEEDWNHFAFAEDLVASCAS